MTLPTPTTPVCPWQPPSATTPGVVDVVRVQRGPFMVVFTTSLSPLAVGMTPTAWYDFLAAVHRGEYDSFEK
ncbi:DUF397 domain-containing protein [Parafrankia sp. FMc2]|uniref:DUF397 domain-containing protein n=1 Tax=Parafrankia sp. FMc2 TaxID=3233196 RepID=UPI0034D66DFA